MNAPQHAVRLGTRLLLIALVLAFVGLGLACNKDEPAPQKPAEPAKVTPAKVTPAKVAPANVPESPEKAEKAAEDKAAEAKAGEAKAGTEKAAPTGETELTGGADIEDAPEPVEVLLWHAYRGDERAALDQLIGAFNAKHENLKIRALPIPFDALVDKLQVTIPRGQGPDIFIFAHNMIGQWLESEAKPLIEPIGTWVKPALLEHYMAAAVKPLVYRKSLYGLPLAYKSVALYYNKKLVKEPPKTTEEMVALAKKLTDVGAKQYGLVYEAASLYFHAPWIHGFGGVILDDENQPHLDSPEQIAAAKFVRELALDEKVIPPDMTTYMVASLFNDGKAGLVISGPWFRGDLEEGLEYGVALLPTVSETGKPAKPLLGIESVFLNAYSEKKKWAFEIMRYLASDESATLRAKVGAQPVPNKAAYEDPAVKSDPFIPVFAEQAKQAVPMNASRQMQVVWGTMDNALKQAIFNPDGSVEEALKTAQEKVTHDIARQRE